MPFIEVEELQEGMTEADVVPRADYDSVVSERDTAAQQRDDALEQVETMNKEVLDVRSKYADYVLQSAKQNTSTQSQDTTPKATMAHDVRTLFSKKEG